MTEITRRATLAGAAASALLPFVKTSPASAAAPQAATQNASFYRYNVGTHQITVVCDGVATVNLTDNYAAGASKDDINKIFAENHLPTDKVTHTFNPVVVNTGPKLVVIDTGLGPDQFTQTKGKVGQFHNNLAAASIDRAAVDTVIISHFHGDHINGLLAAENKPAFPNAEIMVPAVEWKFWMDDGEMSKGTGNPILESNFKNIRRVFDALGRKVTQYESGKEVAPGITSVASPGHTPGHNSFIVASGAEKVLVQVDITAGAAFLFVKHPEWNIASDVDKPLAQETRRKLYDMAIAEKMPIQAFHAAFPGLVRVEKEKDGSGYRWIPSIWNASL
ncbi:glyoxylase-like metal-dependent hydrolase (beta-lactamase superfamily II) [Bradyrhizobium sp. JR7.2]|jgi:glyoxylase-like metal-dependent hydrolase (beta-lactamase superfamily II)|uniref:MBL fold metallo-hydrolase n=1 Tax=Bradyrhizobium japonicum TaxID=375 RepID=A0A1Y2JNH2_BRAJP|nr:MBL fold metallo-hydrolase [Bradyrhizobium japonicum]OSJ32341.1 MBL fold metallo-hydrolase [Bradyrhizobium japonicum]